METLAVVVVHVGMVGWRAWLLLAGLLGFAAAGAADPAGGQTSAPAPAPVASPAPSKPGFWHKVGAMFHAVGAGVSKLFIDVFGPDAAHEFVTGAEAILKTAVGQIAVKAVGDAENIANASSAVKNGAAFSQITSAAAAAGIDLAGAAKAQGLSSATSLINLLIETAVSRLNGLFGPAVPPTPAS
jgi:hypothetical protein